MRGDVRILVIEDELKKGSSLEQAVLNIAPKLEGSYAFLVMAPDKPGKIVGTRRSNPLIVGISGTDCYVSSDALAFSEYTNQVMENHFFIFHQRKVKIPRQMEKSTLFIDILLSFPVLLD